MNADSPKRLGRGLNALFGDQEPSSSETVAPPARAPAPAAAPPAPPAAVVAASTGPVTRLSVDLRAPSPYQPRRHFDETALDELAA